MSRCANLLSDDVVRHSFNLSEKRTALNKQIMGGENMTGAVLTTGFKSNRRHVTLTTALKSNGWLAILTAALKRDR